MHEKPTQAIYQNIAFGGDGIQSAAFLLVLFSQNHNL
jgi:hypothetical protein